MKARSPSTEVVLMTGHAAVEDAVKAMKMGAYDCLVKPFDPDAAALTIARAVERRRLREPTGETFPTEAASMHLPDPPEVRLQAVEMGQYC